MEINNNKSIRGIFLYADDIKFERGDFVVEGDKIYVTKADSIGRQPSKSPEYFQIYLKEEVADLEGEDFINYLKGEGQDKLISAYTVGKLLSMYLTGFDEKGTITNEITEGGSIVLKDYFGNETVSSHTNPLDVILTTPSLNNAIFKVNRAVVESLIGSSSSTTSHYVLLRQYTYSEPAASTSADSIYTRVQELIDEETGVVKYRYSRSSNSYESSIDWISVNTNSKFTSTVDDVINYYSNKCIELDKQKAVLRDSFRFKNIKGSPTGTNTLVMYTSENPISNESFAFFTICTLYAEDSPSSSASGGNSRIYRTDSITVDLLPFYNSNSTRKYGIVSGEYIDITSNVNLGTITFTTSGNSRISNIYMREFLKDVDDSVVGNIHISYELKYTKDNDTYIIPLADNTILTVNKNVSLLITTKLIKQTAVIGPDNGITWATNPIMSGNISTGDYVNKKVTLSVSLDDIPEVYNLELEDKSKYLIVTSTINEPDLDKALTSDAIFFTARVGLCKDQENIYVEPLDTDLSGSLKNKNKSGYYVVPASIYRRFSNINFLPYRNPDISIDSIKSVINE